MNHEQKMEWQRNQRLATGNAHTKKYERTSNGKLMRIYRNMKSRVEGIQKLKAHLYEGKELLSKEQFKEWANSEEYLDMYQNWKDSDFDRKLSPTVDRIDSSLGYTTENMRWLTHSENSSLGSKSQWANKKAHAND